MSTPTSIHTAPLRRQLAPLKARWQRQARRIDALSLRERAIMFLGIVAVLAALFDTLVLTPLSARARQRGEAAQQQAAEVAQLREQFVADSRNHGDPGDALRRRLDTARATRERLDAELRAAGSADEGDGLPTVLQRLLARQPGLVLERLRLLADTPVASTSGAMPGPASAMAASVRTTTDMPALAWQGVELQVQGRYGDLQHYVQALERQLPGLRWGEMRLTAGSGDEPPRLTAQVHLLKVQP
ncbi:hypothetical protein [Pelomonas cellulosilytica]|uniref:MSHA biogenesis protein MshJ n=1 Tax=Pelomonas cellulosilytica TaxID=2906762 RepID=A0ABS8XX81_9BURK|nr:hypothetical protein [Pelomonas sp. P8]MCE4555873.1 hypothetical protein [Pelomonas sp. P8]